MLELVLIFIVWVNNPYSFYEFRPSGKFSKIIANKLSLPSKAVALKFENFLNFDPKHHGKVLEYFFGEYLEWLNVKNGTFRGNVPRNFTVDDLKFIFRVFYMLGLREYVVPVEKMVKDWEFEEKEKIKIVI